ncbi:hypothetical protein ACQY0O_002418 [Thecaphora frezii]
MAAKPPSQLARRIGVRRYALLSLRRSPAASLLLPALKAYALGYLMDILPATIKALLRFVASELKRIRARQHRLAEERCLAREAAANIASSAAHAPAPAAARHVPRRSELGAALWLVAPSLYRLPILFQAILRALFAALGPHGMAISCFAAMAGWTLSESLVWWPIARHCALRLSAHAVDPRDRSVALARARLAATFVAASVSSALSLMVLQHNSQRADAQAVQEAQRRRAAASTLPSQPTASDSEALCIDTTSSWIPKPLRSPRLGFAAQPPPVKVPKIASLAPAGHFLSRLTNLTVPGTPAASRIPLGGGGLPPVSPDARQPASPTELRTMASQAEANIEEHQRQQQQQQRQQQQQQKRHQQRHQQSPQRKASADPSSSKRHALGKPSPTIDLTLFALVRGLDTLVRAVPLLLASSATATATLAARHPALSGAGAGPAGRGPSRWSRLGGALSSQAEGLVFVVCCAQIMWAWFYHPERLPPTYVKWITNLATMDERLLLALRGMRYGEPIAWSYKLRDQMTPASIELISSLSEELGYPYEWGDPTRIPDTAAEARAMLEAARAANARIRAQGGEVATDPLRGGEPGFVFAGAGGARGRGEMGGLPCELIHCGVGGASCYRNAALRWARGWRMSMAIYFPVHLLPRLLFKPRGFFASPARNLAKVVLGAARSAAFLATFIVGNWLPICLARTHLPRLFPRVPHSEWDSGLGPLLGSMACGFSIFLEQKRKRAEMALYVAPRALFALAESARNGWLSQGHKSAVWVERVIFGMAVGTVVSAARYRPDLLRGITGAMRWVVGGQRARNTVGGGGGAKGFARW